MGRESPGTEVRGKPWYSRGIGLTRRIRYEILGFGLVVSQITLGCGGAEKANEEAAVKAEAEGKAEAEAKAKAEAEAKAKAEAEAKAKADAAKEEVVFDPKNPPQGYTKCHRNHCHKVGGGVASYTQVMEEMGATKMINVPKRAPMPAAPADVAAPPADAEKTASGLASKQLRAGDGGAARCNQRVTVHYTGWTTDGKAFDSSVARGKPATFPLNRVIAGWTEGLQLMTVGEERRFWIPQDLAYKGRPGPPAGMLVFDVELLEFKDAAAAPAGR